MSRTRYSEQARASDQLLSSDQARDSKQTQRAKRLHLRPGDYGRRSQDRFSSLGALFGFAGMGALFLGASLCGVAWLAGASSAHAWLNGCGVALLVLCVPLLACGAHYFDKADANEAAARSEAAASKGED